MHINTRGVIDAKPSGLIYSRTFVADIIFIIFHAPIIWHYIDVTVFSSSELFICTKCHKRLIRFLVPLLHSEKCKRLRNESTSEIAASEQAHNVCTESLRSGGTSVAKSLLKFLGPTTCIMLLLALSLPLSCPLICVVSLREMKQGSKSRFPKIGKRPVIGPPP